MMSAKAQTIIEKRNLRRWQLIFYLRVFEEETGQLLGYVVDISTSGLMLISDQPIPIGQDYNLWLDIPQDEAGQRSKISLHARSLWSRKDVNPDFLDTGFCLVDVTTEQVHRIQLIIDDFKFHG